MNNIVIPGFYVKFSNDTYLRRLRIDTDEQIPATQILQLDRYRIPTSDELLELIRIASESSTGYGRIPSLGKYIARMIPDIEERTKIGDGDEKLFKRIKLSMPYLHYDSGRDYLRINQGIVPDKEIEEFDEKEMLPGIFSWLIGEKSYNPWQTFTRLEQGLFLPSDLDIQFAFENRIFDSSLLMVNCNKNPCLYPEIEKICRKVYVGLRLGKIEELEDISEWFEEKLARSIIKSYVQEKDIFEIIEHHEENNENNCDEGHGPNPRYNARFSDN